MGVGGRGLIGSVVSIPEILQTQGVVLSSSNESLPSAQGFVAHVSLTNLDLKTVKLTVSFQQF